MLIVDVVVDLCGDTEDDDIESLLAIITKALTGGEKTYPYPLAQPDAEASARSLDNGVFSKFGFNRTLHTHGGSAFVSQLMK